MQKEEKNERKANKFIGTCFLGIKMKEDIRKKEYMIQEAFAYYVLGYQRYKKDNNENDCMQILKNILEVARDNINTTQITGVNTNLLNRINFSWKLSADDFVAYAVCIFYVLTNREKNITDEKILKKFLSELHTHHPRKILKEAEFILTNFFPDLNN